MGYTKLSSELVMSTVWREEKHVRLVWITMLALKDQSHEVLASVPGLADSARVSLPECEDALRVLSAPDAYSRSQAEGGRRLIAIPGGWFVVNGESYRRKQSREEFKEKKAAYMREYRKNKDSVTGTVTNRADCNQSNPIRSDQNKSEQDPPLPSVVTPQGVNRDIAKDGLDSFVADPVKLRAKRAKKRLTEYPEGLAPLERQREKCATLRLDCDREFEKFSTFHRSKSSVYADWSLAFDTWLGNAVGFQRPGARQPQPKQPNGGSWKPRVERAE